MNRIFSELYFIPLKEEIKEFFLNKKLKGLWNKDKMFFFVFEKQKENLNISLDGLMYFISISKEFKENIEELREYPFLKNFILKKVDIIEGERILFLDFVFKNPLGELKKRKVVVDFTKKAKDMLILENERVLFSFRKNNSFSLVFSPKPNIFGEPSEMIDQYIKKNYPFLYKYLNMERDYEKFKLRLKELLLKGEYYVDENFSLFFEKKENTKMFSKISFALDYIYKTLINLKLKEKEKRKKEKFKDRKKEEQKVSPDIYKKKGDLILIHKEKLKNKIGKFVLKDMDGKEYEIEIKRGETPAKAAERYYKLFKKRKKKIEIEKNINKIKNQKTLRIFISPSGFKVYVSKDKEEANKITFKIAKPWDFFLHLRDFPSPHAIIKISKSEKPNKEDILFAAKVLKRFSKLKEEKKVAVLYTKKRYVKPIKGEKGKVKILKENVIWI